LVSCNSSDSSNNNSPSSVDWSFSDAAVDGASEVVITVDRIIFQPSDDSVDDIVVDQFNGNTTTEDVHANNTSTTDESNETVEAETYTIDLLTVQGNDSKLVLDNIKLPVGSYTNMLIEVIDDDVTNSYVSDAEGIKPLKVPSQTLKLGGFTNSSTSSQSMVVEFGLQQSMTYNPGPDRYILKPRGVRIVSIEEASLIDGVIDHSSLQAFEQCDALDLGGTAGNIYLYEGHSLDV